MNEEADRSAKEGSQLPLEESSSATYANIKMMIKATKNQKFREWWKQALPKYKRYQNLEFKSITLKCPRKPSYHGQHYITYSQADLATATSKAIIDG